MSGTPRFVTLYGVHPSGTSIQRSGSSREIFLTASANLIRNREFHVDYLGHAHGKGGGPPRFTAIVLNVSRRRFGGPAGVEPQSPGEPGPRRGGPLIATRFASPCVFG